MCVWFGFGCCHVCVLLCVSLSGAVVHAVVCGVRACECMYVHMCVCERAFDESLCGCLSYAAPRRVVHATWVPGMPEMLVTSYDRKVSLQGMTLC